MKCKILLCILMVNILLMGQIVTAGEHGNILDKLIFRLQLRNLKTKIVDLTGENSTKRKQLRLGRYGHFVGKRIHKIEDEDVDG